VFIVIFSFFSIALSILLNINSFVLLLIKSQNYVKHR